MVPGEVAGLINRELVMAGVHRGYYRDKMADRLLKYYRKVLQFYTVFGNEQEA